MRITPTLIFLLLGSLPLHAQQTFFVDPEAGNDTTGTGGSSDPFLSLTHALTVVGAGDNIELRTGTYSSPSHPLGIGNLAETFPIVLVPGVDVGGGIVQSAVFDGSGGVGVTIFSLAQDFLTPTTLSQVEVSNCETGLSNDVGNGTPPPARLRGFILEESIFTFTDNGATFNFAGTEDNQVVVRDSYFTGESLNGVVGVGFNITSGGDLSGGAVERCEIAGCAIGVQVQATGGAGGVADFAVGTGFEIKANLIRDFSLVGVRIAAVSDVNGECKVGCLVTGNDINGGHGSPAFPNQVGLHLESSNTTPSGRAALMESRVEYNNIHGCETCVKLTTNSGQISLQADLTSAFLGNLIENSSQAGVVFEVNGIATSQTNNSPDFGTFGAFLEEGRNSIAAHPLASGPGVTPATGSVVLDDDMVSPLPNFQGNWWDKASLVSAASVLSSSINNNGGTLFGTSQLSPVFQFELTVSVSSTPITAGEMVTIFAGESPINDAFFHDENPDSELEEMVLQVGGSPIDLPGEGETTLTPTGDEIEFRFPNLPNGNYDLLLMNPGGFTFAVGSQPPSFEVTGSGGSGGSGSGGSGSGGSGSGGSEESGGPCFVATAAFEDPHAAEVETLRRFRDRWLLTWEGGRSFVRWYYEKGPLAAEWVGPRPWARAAARIALAPPVWMATALDRWNPGQRLLAGIMLLGLAFSLGRRRRMSLST